MKPVDDVDVVTLRKYVVDRVTAADPHMCRLHTDSIWSVRQSSFGDRLIGAVWHIEAGIRRQTCMMFTL